MTARRTVLIPLVLVLASAVPVQQATVTAVAGDTLALSVGARDGVAVGMTGKVLGPVTVGDRTTVEEVAYFRVTRVQAASNRALRTAGNIPLAGGMTVRFDQALVKPTAEPPRPTPTPRGPAAGERRRFAPHDGEWAWVPPGTFQMGCVPGDPYCGEDEKPRHAVTLSCGYWMTSTEVTVGQYRAFASATGRPPPPAAERASIAEVRAVYDPVTGGSRIEVSGPPDGDDHPVVNVSWDDALAYCRWAGGRLPTEAEWERAARGGRDGLLYPWGDSLRHDDANYSGTGGKDRWGNTSPVGSFAPNAYGLCDMAGKVWEWVADWYDEGYFTRSPSTDPAGPPSGQYRVLRGGSCGVNPWGLRASYRDQGDPSPRGEISGFRCALDGG